MNSTHRRNIGWVILIGAILFLPLLGQVTLFDWDEANFAECAREMILRGKYSSVSIDFLPFYEKPPLFFWLQVLCMQLLGIGEYAARLPSALIGICSLVVYYSIGRRYFDTKLAWYWVLFYIASWTPHIYFKSGIIDPTFNFFIFLSIYFYFKSSKQDWTHLILSAVSMALAIITKGPVALLILGLVILFYTLIYHSSLLRQWKFYAQHLAYVALILLFASAWYVYTYMHDGGDYIRIFVEYQIELLTQGVATHGQPFYYHFVALLVGCFPASIFLLDKKSWKAAHKSDGNASRTRMTRMMWVLFWVVLILFSIVKTKIVHYSSLCYIPLTFLASRYVSSIADGTSVLSTRLMSAAYWVLGVAWALALIALPIVAMHPESLRPYIGDANTLNALSVPVSWSYWHSLAGVIMLLTLILFWRHRWQAKRSMFTLTVGMVLSIQFVLYFVAPKISQYSQGESVAFYKSFAGKPVDLKTYNYKSYAVYFYAKRMPESKNYPEKYYVCHKAQLEGILEEAQGKLEPVTTHYNFTLIKEIQNENREENTQ